MFGESSKKWKGLSLATTLVALSAVVLAWNVTWNAPITLQIESIDLKVYWESNFTTPVTTIDFGNINRSSYTYSKVMYIRNEGIGPVYIRWNSSLASVTDQITDEWNYNYYYNIAGISLGPGATLQTYYRIHVNQTVDPGSLSWTLYLGAEQ